MSVQTQRKPEQHGMAGTPLYRRWRAMLHRCSSPTNIDWKNYGGRGITVCERWQTFGNFYADMGDPPPGMSLDRIDNDGPYSPENCRWATQSRQTRNMRKTVMLEHGGVVQSLSDWADALGVPYRVLHCRLRHGWSVERTVTTPRISWGSVPVKSPAPGVHWNAETKKWRAMSYHRRKSYHHGLFDDWREAAAVAAQARLAHTP
jgi:hypothetical protein